MSKAQLKIQHDKIQGETFEHPRLRKTIDECVGYWNREGQNVYEKNKSGELGSSFTQEKARKQTFEDFILDCIKDDCVQLAKSPSYVVNPTHFKAGRTTSHVWLQYKNNRMLMIHF